MSNDLESLFQGVRSAGKVNDYAPQIPAGDHLLALRFGKLRQTLNRGRMIETEFSVVTSTNDSLKEAAAVGEPYFVDHKGQSGWEDTYAKKRLNGFVEAMVACLGMDPNSETQQQDVSFALVDKTTAPLRGVLIRCIATEKTSNGKTIVNRKWVVHENTAESIKETRAWLDQHAPLEDTPAKAAPAPAPTAAPPAAPAPSGLPSALANLPRFKR